MITAQKYAHGDTPLAELSGEVKQAAEAILAVLSEQDEQSWTPRALVDAAIRHADVDLSKTVMSIAFWNLVESEFLAIDEQLNVRLGKSA